MNVEEGTLFWRLEKICNLIYTPRTKQAKKMPFNRRKLRAGPGSYMGKVLLMVKEEGRTGAYMMYASAGWKETA